MRHPTSRHEHAKHTRITQRTQRTSAATRICYNERARHAQGMRALLSAHLRRRNDRDTLQLEHVFSTTPLSDEIITAKEAPHYTIRHGLKATSSLPLPFRFPLPPFRPHNLPPPNFPGI